MRLLLIGCTGCLGLELVPTLIEAGHKLILVSRKKDKVLNPIFQGDQISHIQIDPSKSESWENKNLLDALEKAEGVINFAGEPIADQRWSKKHCQKIKSSRIASTYGLINAISKLKRSPKVLVNGSAIGFYGTSQDSIFTEDSPCGKDFLADLCNEWEKVSFKKPRSTRLVIFRIGIILAKDKGALGKMLPIFKAGLGGPLGDGGQWMSWIDRTDLCQMISRSIVNSSWSGVINAVAPNPVSMAIFSKTLGECLNRPALLKVPGAILKLFLGDGAKVVLEGQKVISDKLKRLNFKFKYPTLSEALNKSINE